MGRPTAGSTAAHRVLTVPNALSGLRLLGAPVFLWLLVTGADGWALLLLALSGISDYLDGTIARRFSQQSRLGELLDPIADRLYIVATITGLAWRSILPLWVVALIVSRELLMGVVLLAVRRTGHVGLPVHEVGKAATFNLLYAFPILLLAEGTGTLAAIALPVGWAFAWWGIGLHWWAAVLYTGQARALLGASRAARALPGAGR